MVVTIEQTGRAQAHPSPSKNLFKEEVDNTLPEKQCQRFRDTPSRHAFATRFRWLAVLAATFQWFELPAYQGNAIKRISSKPKGYLSDTGLACHLSRITSPDALGGHPMAGALFETAVVSEIRKLQSAMPRKAALYHWRTHGGSEVDLVLERDGLLYPIEIKLASRPTRNDARGFTALRASNPRQRIAPGLVLAPAEHIERLTDNEFVAPYDMV